MGTTGCNRLHPIRSTLNAFLVWYDCGMTNKPTPKPRPAAKKADETVIEDAVQIVDAEVQPIADMEEVEELIVDAAAAGSDLVDEDVQIVEAVVAPPVKTSTPPPTVYSVVSGADKDVVALKNIVFKNAIQKKSLSVHHLQRRLVEWGFGDSYADRDGYFGVNTLKAIHDFQEAQNLPTGDLDIVTLKAIFEGDTNVKVTE